ncbi:C40 family peptidase [Homoserinibacter sp. GY 40078]|uniref:C40 family peptidase n=1 Tax=Homoserinibacter sp. GY 40078 TaxID=2603275 RepID=UPI0011C8C09C|nr:C40 family peptidase [Homoserinibacter sp. GY 40078]TXK19370.1 NlpC/P60 family protein [Homoserinibacter sp. GY 40078]
MAVVVPGLFATVALPAYAYNPDAAPTTALEARAQLAADNAQSIEVEDVEVAAAKRDSYETVSAATRQRAAQRAAFAAYSGPTVRDYLANPPYPNFDLSKVVDVALQYQGVPYRYGGATPAGFDCSGFVMFVYAQFGVSLPHSSSAQGAGSGGGHIISRADARPGDIVVMDGGGHSGIYMGGNTMVHSPRPGRFVEVHNIWDSNAWFVRYGI